MTKSIPTLLNTLKITVTKTANGKQEYVQIMSDDQFTVNMVLIAQQIEVLDTRNPMRPKPLSWQVKERARLALEK
jgi:hypothetical protein